jgi:hypothetical protein
MSEEYENTPIGMAEEMQREVAEMNGEQPMDDEELQSIVGAEIEDAISYIDSDLSPFRAQATDYYRGDPFGNEEEGQSHVVATEVRDTVNAMLPSIMRTMFSSERIVEYVPRGPEDVANAEQATDYANYVLQQDNDGFMVMYATFKDALVRKCGIVKTLTRWATRSCRRCRSSLTSRSSASPRTGALWLRAYLQRNS